MTKPFIVFTPESFDRLRATLRAHLGEVLLERDHRTLIMNLIDDVKKVASDEGNRILNERGTRVLGKEFQFDKYEPFTIWKEKPDSVDKVASKYEALLLGQREIEK